MCVCVLGDYCPGASGSSKDILSGQQEPVQTSKSTEGPIQGVYMLEDVHKLKNLLATERNKNNRLLKFMEKKMLGKQRSTMYVDVYYMKLFIYTCVIGLMVMVAVDYWQGQTPLEAWDIPLWLTMRKSSENSRVRTASRLTSCSRLRQTSEMFCTHTNGRLMLF